MQTKEFMNSDDVESLIDVMAGKLWTLTNLRAIEAPLIIGIRTGGVWLAEILHQIWPLGVIALLTLSVAGWLFRHRTA